MWPYVKFKQKVNYIMSHKILFKKKNEVKHN